MKKVRRFLATICTLALATAMGVSSVGGLAYAALTEGPDAAFSISVSVDSTVEYGESFNVPAANGASVKVTAPNGKVVAEAAGDVTADQLGCYVVEYYNEAGASYTFKVQSSLAGTYDLHIGEKVDSKFYYSSDLPTYIEVGKSAKIPAAYVVETVDGETVYGAKVAPKFSGVAVTENDGTVTFGAAGIVYVTYETTVEGGTKVLSTVKEIKVQADVNDEVAPTMTITNFPKTGQLNSKVTLPKASVSDNYDATATVEISVLDPNGKEVASATVNEDTGYATEAGEDVLYFDNANSRTYYADGAKSYSGMYFYPVVKGDYKVTYKAIDDAGNAAEVKEYTIAVSDGKAPTVTYDASSIPSKWGWNSVTNKAGEEVDNAIVFGMPEFYDNTSDKDALKVTFTMTDPEGKTVVRFDNINANEDVVYTSTNSVFDAEKPSFTFENASKTFTFDIKGYVEAIKAAIAEDGTSYAVTGNYTVYYTVKDETGNTVSTSNYYINVVDDYTDEAEPSVSFDNVPDRVVLKDGVEFTVPSVSYYSAEDSKLATTYEIKSGDDAITVAAGEVLTYENGMLGDLAVSGDLTLYATATSDAGNTASKEVTVKVVKADSTANAYEIKLAVNDEAELKVGAGEINYGAIAVNGVDADNVKNVGIELGVKNADGEYLSNLSAEIYWAENTKIVRDITFTPTAAGTYYLEVKVFDVYGTSEIRVYEIEIEDKQAGGSIESGASAGTLPTSAEIYATVELANKSFTLNNYADYIPGATVENGYIVVGGNNYYVATAHTISGGRFSLMGEELVMMTTGTYRVTDRPIIVSADVPVFDYVGDDKYEAWLNSYAVAKKSISATQTGSITFETIGFTVPAYAKGEGNYEAVNLPGMAAYSAVANASEIKVEVTHSNGTSYKVTDNADGTYTFTPNADGVYTVTYNAVVGGTSDSVSYTIKVGDVTAPALTFDGTHNTTANVGDSFEFLVINTTGESGITYLKSLIKDGSTVATIKTRAGKGENIEFTESGTYEVKYEITDASGNTTVKTFTITVSEKAVDTVSTWTVVSWILLGVAAVLIVGIVVYVIVSRKKKTN